nr:unnamed protein product [Digitaria exilis]
MAENKLLPALFFLLVALNLVALTAGDDHHQFVYSSGFTGSDLTLDGAATVTETGLLELTNGTLRLKGHVIYPTRLPFRDTSSTSSNATTRSFSTSFVFGILSAYPDVSANGIAFFVAASKDFSGAMAAQYLGLLNTTNNGNSTNHVFAVELDTMQNNEFKDISDNHVGIDINSLISVNSTNAGYHGDGDGDFHNLTLISHEAMQVWVDYDGETKKINVTLAPLNMGKPVRPLISTTHDLSTVIPDMAYIGFSSSTGLVNSRHYVLGWSFAMDGPAPEIDISKLPKLPREFPKPRSKVMEIILPIATAAVVLFVGTVLVLLRRRQLRYSELREDWELDWPFPVVFSSQPVSHVLSDVQTCMRVATILWSCGLLLWCRPMRCRHQFTLHTAAYLSNATDQFIYTGFTGGDLTLNGAAMVTTSGLLELTNGTTHQKGHAFHPSPLLLRESPDSPVRSFSVAFVFGIISNYLDFSTHGLAIAIVPSTKSMSNALTDQYLGLTNAQDDGNVTNHMFAVELDTVQNLEFHDINANHVGIDINGLSSVQSHDAGYFDDSNGFQNLSLISRDAMQVWVDYDGKTMMINVTIAPVATVKPKKPLLSYIHNLSEVLAVEPSYIGFSSATGPGNSRHYVLGWSFGMNRPAPVIDITKLPKLPQFVSKPRSKVLEITLPIASAALVLTVGIALILLVRRRLRYSEVREDWESEFGPHRFTYKDLFHATKGFKDKHLLGAGGFGMVYRGQLQKSGVEVAVKKVSHGSKQGMKEFIAEIVSIGHIRHRNLVQLLGYCRRKDELILVYDYMPNGSLDKYLYTEEDDQTLDWGQRFRIIKGVASGLHFLHERWEKVVVHRDIKTSNVLLDKEMNGRLGDFGLAKLYEHGANPQTTRVVGTTGYLAPELVRTGKATPFTDVFTFGTTMLEVTCGQRPIKQDEQGNQFLLVDWVLQQWHNESLLEAVDPRLLRKSEYNSDEVRLVLQVGLLCTHPSAAARPSMQQVLQYLDGEMPLPEMTRADLSFDVLALLQRKGLHVMSCPCSSSNMVSAGSISDLSGGR